MKSKICNNSQTHSNNGTTEWIITSKKGDVTHADDDPPVFCHPPSDVPVRMYTDATCRSSSCRSCTSLDCTAPTYLQWRNLRRIRLRLGPIMKHNEINDSAKKGGLNGDEK